MNQISTLIGATILAAGFVSGQIVDPLPVVGAGYRLAETNALPVAPGQFLIISVGGIQTSFPNPVVAVVDETGRQPQQISGIQVILHQSAEPRDVIARLKAVQQRPCPNNATCPPITSISVTIPWELRDSATAENPAYLEVREGSRSAGLIPIRYVTDAVHVITSCDETKVSVGIFSGTQEFGCLPAVQHANGLVVSPANPARVGESLMMTAYGLGQTNPPMTDAGFRQQPAVLQVYTLGFDFSPNAAATRPTFGVTPTVNPFYAAATSTLGSYQLNFTIPAPASGVTVVPCSGSVRSNLTISITGNHSMDSVPICVQP